MKKLLIIAILSSSLSPLFSDSADFEMIEVKTSVIIENKNEIPKNFRLIEKETSLFLQKKDYSGWKSGPAINWRGSGVFHIENYGRELPTKINMTFRISRIFDGPRGPELQVVLSEKSVSTTWNKTYSETYGSKKPIKIIKAGVLYIKGTPRSSFLEDETYANRYSVLSMFDGDPATGWAEGARNSGMGTSFTIQFKEAVDVDSIKIMPGWFEASLFKKNNRVKKLSVEVNGEKFFCSFDDIMKPQMVSFGKNISFSEITFTLVDYYKGTKWNDTPIAEIQFYSNSIPLYCFFDAINLESSGFYSNVSYNYAQ